MYCRSSFLSANEGYQTDLIILVRETADYALNDDKFYIDLENQIKEITLSDLPAEIDTILKGQQIGRIRVKI